MKHLNDEKKKYLYWGITALLVIIAAILCNNILSKFDVTLDVLSMIFKALQPIIFGVVFAYVLNPLLNIYEKYIFTKLFSRIMKNNPEKVKGTSRAAGIFLSVLTGVAVAAGLILMIVPELYVNVVKLVNNMPTYFKNVNEFINNIVEENPQIPAFMDNFLASLDDISNDLMNFATEKFLPNANSFITKLSAGIYGTLKTLLNVIIGIIAAIYLLASKETYAAVARKLVYAFLKKDKAEKTIELVEYTDDRFGGFLIGKIVDSAIIGVICFIVCSVFQIPYTLLVSAIVGVTNVIPFFGPFIGAIPTALLILLVNPVKAFTFVIIIIVIQQFDGNILGPKILGDRTGLDSFGVIFAILLAGGLFGIAGMILGVPLFAVIFGLINKACDKNLKEKNMPTDNSAYVTDEALKKALDESKEE